MNLLLEMLRYKRPHNSTSEWEFIEKFIVPIPRIQFDACGNYYIKIGDTATAFSCHLDTMHRAEGFQTVIVDESLGIAFSNDDKDVLGADDAVGIYIMIKLIEAEVPGLYIFHRGEERGGIGSKWIVENNPELVSDIKRMIAFDRHGNTDVVTHQSFVNTASVEFATALAAALGGAYSPCSQGVYTDTYEYADLIPECTNVSCGYSGEHTTNEHVCLYDVEYLLSRALTIDWDSLPTGTREPEEMFEYEYAPSIARGMDSKFYYMSQSELIAYIAANPEEIADYLLDNELA